MINLNKDSYTLLKTCLERYKPELITLIENNRTKEYSEELYNQLRQVVGDELIARGFNSDYSPNEYGLKLEDLIDELGRLFM